MADAQAQRFAPGGRLTADYTLQDGETLAADPPPGIGISGGVTASGDTVVGDLTPTQVGRVVTATYTIPSDMHPASPFPIGAVAQFTFFVLQADGTPEAREVSVPLTD